MYPPGSRGGGGSEGWDLADCPPLPQNCTQASLVHCVGGYGAERVTHRLRWVMELAFPWSCSVQSPCETQRSLSPGRAGEGLSDHLPHWTDEGTGAYRGKRRPRVHTASYKDLLQARVGLQASRPAILITTPVASTICWALCSPLNLPPV